MNNQKLVDIIIKDSEEIESLTQNFAKYGGGQIPKIYIELTLSKVKNLYSELQLLNKNDFETPEVKPIEDTKQPFFNPFKSYKPHVINKIEKNHQFLLTQTGITDKKDTLLKDYKQSSKITSYDIIAKKREEQFLSTQLKFESIKNIKEVIELNDKIWFIKELFNGSIDLYNKTLDILNSCENLHQAIDYLDENFVWNLDSQTVKDFFQFVLRKFI